MYTLTTLLSQELEVIIVDMERTMEDLRGSLSNSEKRRIALSTELEDCRSALENAERARKSAENERDEATSRLVM